MLRVANVMRSDVPTCPLASTIGTARTALGQSDWQLCVVVNDERVILGLLYGKAWDAPDDTPVETVMSNGPPTTRPSTFIDDMVERLHRRKTPGILISGPNGVLMGYLWTSDAERALASGNCAHPWPERTCPPSEIG